MGVENGVEVHPGQDGSQPPAYTNQQQPYTNQPPALPPGLPQANQQQWMPAVGASAGCPSGLEYLTQIDSVIIKQQVDLIEVFSQKLSVIVSCKRGAKYTKGTFKLLCPKQTDNAMAKKEKSLADKQ
ncbi:hypothetical protein AM593_09544, partial [Mytilus galloprovincialis]